ncbi:MAG: Lrp/AsnC ligand binding domain-containing protein [candidate division Zixibacteria bacterium]|nr:Lrp/AsnC ligand binding domain-containing protein [candidate division Zixibacteria bacterium]
MAIKAFILIEMEPRSINGALEVLNELPQIKSATAVAGPYDIVAILESKSYEDIPRIITKQIQAVEGVLKTTTLLAFE